MTQQLMDIARASVLEEMASGFAHELNQPLGAIATFAQTGMRMLDRPEPMVTEARQLFRHICEQAMDAGAGIRTIRRLFDNDVSNMRRQPIADVIRVAAFRNMRAPASFARSIPPKHTVPAWASRPPMPLWKPMKAP